MRGGQRIATLTVVADREPARRPIRERARDEAGKDGADHGGDASKNSDGRDLVCRVKARVQ